MRVISAYTALKQSAMMRDMQAMASDYPTEDTTANITENMNKIEQLTKDVADLHNKTLVDGIFADILHMDDATLLYSNAADIQWLKDQLAFDINHHQYNVWGK